MRKLIFLLVGVLIVLSGCGDKEESNKVKSDSNKVLIEEESDDSNKNVDINSEIDVDDKENSQVKMVSDITFKVDVSSIFDETVSGETLIYSPLYIADNKMDTAWVEGSSSNGENEWLLFESEDNFNLSTIQLTNGFAKSESLYNKNNKVAEIQVISSNGDIKIINLDDKIVGFQEFDVNFNNINSVKLIITKVYKGTHYKDLCVSELRFNNERLNLELSENSKNLISKLEKKNSTSNTNSKYVGQYSIADENSGFYDSNYNLVEKFNWASFKAQVGNNFALLNNGKVTRNEGASSYYSGTWSVEGNILTIKSDSGNSIKYIYKDGMLFGEIGANYERIYDFSNDNVKYEGLSRQPLEDWNYPDNN